MNIDNMKIMPQGMSSILQNKISETVLFINRDSVLSIVNSSGKFISVKYSIGECINEVEDMDERYKRVCLEEKKCIPDLYFVDTNEKINSSENKMITEEVMVNKLIMNEFIDDEDVINYDNKSIMDTLSYDKDKMSSDNKSIMDTLSYDEDKMSSDNKSIMDALSYDEDKMSSDNKSIIDTLIDDEDTMSSVNKERLKEIYTSKIDKYFSFIQLTNEDEIITLSKIYFQLQKEIVFLEDFIEIEILNIRIKMKMVEKLSELVEHCNFKEELLKKTKEMTLKDLLFKKDKKNYYLTNVFSETLKKYYKYINRSKLYDIERNKDASNSIISLVLAKYDKEGII